MCGETAQSARRGGSAGFGGERADFRAPRQLHVHIDQRRAADEEALDLAAALATQESPFALGLDALRDYRDLEGVPEADDGAHDRGRLRVGFDAGDEALIDLD